MVEAEADERIGRQPVKFDSVVAGFADPECANFNAFESRIHFSEEPGEIIAGRGYYCRGEAPPASLQFRLEIAVTDAGHLCLRQRVSPAHAIHAIRFARPKL